MIKTGDTIPNLALKSASKDFISDFDLHKNFKNKRILLVCVPGAYTSTCHNKHMPPFIDNANLIKKTKRIDEIFCISVNDPYVMQQWNISLKADNIVFLSDGNSDFGIKTGLLKPFNHNLMGIRLSRSILIIDNLILENIIVDKTGMFKTSYDEILKII